jgi:hypothetical protein
MHMGEFNGAFGRSEIISSWVADKELKEALTFISQRYDNNERGEELKL